MNLPSLVVVVNLLEAPEKAAQYAAVLGAPLPAHVTLLYCYHNPVLMVPEMAVVTATQTDRNYAESAAGIQALAGRAGPLVAGPCRRTPPGQLSSWDVDCQRHAALAGLSGVLLGNIRLRAIGIVGYAGVFPLAVLLMALLFHRSGLPGKVDSIAVRSVTTASRAL